MLNIFYSFRKKNSHLSSLNSQLLTIFAGEMKRSEFWTNAILVLLVAILAAICIRSVVQEQQRSDKLQELRDDRNK